MVKILWQRFIDYLTGNKIAIDDKQFDDRKHNGVTRRAVIIALKEGRVK